MSKLYGDDLYLTYLRYHPKWYVILNEHPEAYSDFEKEVNDLVIKTMNSLSPDILRDLEYYYKLDTLTRIVFKAHTILLIDYMDKNNIEFKNKVQSR